MSARDLFAKDSPEAQSWALVILSALTTAGWRLVGPDEVDPVTVERCAAISENKTRMRPGESGDQLRDRQRTGIQVAGAIRALASGGQQ